MRRYNELVLTPGKFNGWPDPGGQENFPAITMVTRIVRLELSRAQAVDFDLNRLGGAVVVVAVSDRDRIPRPHRQVKAVDLALLWAETDGHKTRGVRALFQKGKSAATLTLEPNLRQRLKHGRGSKRRGRR